MRFYSALLASVVVFSPLANAQVASVFSDITSGAGSIASDATSVAASLASVGTSGAASLASVVTSNGASIASGVFETVTSVGPSVVTVITSAGGKAVTLGASGASGAVGDITSFYQSATAAAHSNAASQNGVLGVASAPLCASIVTVLAGVSFGAWAIL